MNASRRVQLAVGAFVALYLLLLVTDTRVLIWGKTLEPGGAYLRVDNVALGKNDQAALVCTYFTGRKIVNRLYWHSPNDLFGRDRCPFIARPPDED